MHLDIDDLSSCIPRVHLSAADTVNDALDISIDKIYRR